MLVVCAHCLATNRVPPERAAEDPDCGKCGRPLLDGRPVELDDDRFDAVTGKTGLPVVVYPNSGEQWDARERAWSGDGTGFAALAGEWTGSGARLVGGCCRTGPDAIGVLAGQYS